MCWMLSGRSQETRVPARSILEDCVRVVDKVDCSASVALSAYVEPQNTHPCASSITVLRV